jgi:hypothetical protein
MAMFKILVPYNLTANDKKALEFVFSMFLEQPEAEVTLYHVHSPVPDIPIGKDTVMEKMRSSISYLNQRLQEQENELRNACLDLVEKGFAETRVRKAFEPKRKDLATDIIEKAQSGNYQMIVLNRKAGRAARFFTAPVHAKVAAGITNATVCIVT